MQLGFRLSCESALIDTNSINVKMKLIHIVDATVVIKQYMTAPKIFVLSLALQFQWIAF